MLASPFPESKVDFEGLSSVKSDPEKEPDFGENYPFHLNQTQVSLNFAKIIDFALNYETSPNKTNQMC